MHCFTFIMSDVWCNNNDVSPRGTLCKNNDQSLSTTFRNNSSFSEVLQISAIAEEGVALSQYLAISDLLTNFGKGGIASKSLEVSAFVVWS